MNVNLNISFHQVPTHHFGTMAAAEKGDGGGDGTMEPGDDEEDDEEEGDEGDEDHEDNLWRYQTVERPRFRVEDDYAFSDEVQEILDSAEVDNPISFGQWAPERVEENLGFPISLPMPDRWQFSRPRRQKKASPRQAPSVGPDSNVSGPPKPRGLRFQSDGFGMNPDALFQVIQDGYIQEMEFLPPLEGLIRDPNFVPSDEPRTLSTDEAKQLAGLRRLTPLRGPGPKRRKKKKKAPRAAAAPPPRHDGTQRRRPIPPAVSPAEDDEPPPPTPREPTAERPTDAPGAFFELAPPRRIGRRSGVVMSSPASSGAPPAPPEPKPAARFAPGGRQKPVKTAISPQRAYQAAAVSTPGPKPAPVEQEGGDDFPERGFQGQAPAPSRRRAASRRGPIRVTGGGGGKRWR